MFKRIWSQIPVVQLTGLAVVKGPQKQITQDRGPLCALTPDELTVHTLAFLQLLND